MRLYIQEQGGYLKKDNESFVYKNNGMTKYQSAKEVSQIILDSKLTISTGAIELASEYSIEIIFLNNFGDIQGMYIPVSYIGRSNTKRNQILASTSEKFILDFAKEIVKAKIFNQATLLSKLDERNKIKFEEVRKTRDELRKISKYEIDKVKEIKQLLGSEGNSANMYWEAYRYYLNKELEFNSRTKRPAYDITNACLNYSYAILNGSVEKALLLSGLEPSLGYYHKDRSSRPSLSLDLMEVFRSYVTDYTVITLLRQKQITTDNISQNSHGIILDKESRQILAKNTLEKLQKIHVYNQKKFKIETIILENAQAIVRSSKILEVEKFWRWKS